ncbi:MAG TPA: hypothetical protein VEU47_10155 [Candidatus Cybelea sp.]|nr:hypothetical protein [Candidatus Cybelea sp.]
MAEPKTNAAIVAFEHVTLGSATEEFKQFETRTALRFFRHLGEVAGKNIDHWKLAEFDKYRDIPMYKAEIDPSIMIYAVEHQSLGDLKVTVMFCGKLGSPSRAGRYTWDGIDLAALRRNVIQVRAAAWFV